MATEKRVDNIIINYGIMLDVVEALRTGPVNPFIHMTGHEYDPQADDCFPDSVKICIEDITLRQGDCAIRKYRFFGRAVITDAVARSSPRPRRRVEFSMDITFYNYQGLAMMRIERDLP
ncbi:MAG: hypothetical protein Q7R83_01835 [bacterium]|nr:hypothetical protein [bacterium]